VSGSNLFREPGIAAASGAALCALTARQGGRRRAAGAALTYFTARAKAGARRRIAAIAAVAGLVVPLAVALPAAAASGAGMAPPDTVTQWNLTMIAGLEAAGIPPPPAARIGAIVQASVFDAVNGIDRRYAYYHVPRPRPPGPPATPPPRARPTPRWWP
jgi:hypothetical protein